MAFPWIFESNFELGTNADWDSEQDSDGVLDFPSYSELALSPWSTSTPYTGANCMRILLDGVAQSDTTVTEADINIADTVTNSFHFNIWFSSDFTATADDTFPFLELQGTAVTGAVGARIVAATDVINMGIGSSSTGTVPSQFASLAMERNQWYTIEATFNIETNASGTADLYITKAGDVAQTTADASLTSVTNVAVTDGVFGIQDHEATTTGTILLDNFIQDDARVFPFPRYPLHPIFTMSGHAFVGPGHLDIAGLLTDEATNIMRLWDTDTANTDATQTFVVELDIDGTFTSFAGPIKFQSGCYVELSGTDPRGEVVLTQDSDRPGVLGPRYHSDAGVRRWGLSP